MGNSTNTLTMKFVIVTFVVVAAASIDGEEVLDRSVLEDNGMNDIKEIIGSIDGMAKGAEDLNTMESRLQGLEEEAEAVYKAREILTSNMDKTKLEFIPRKIAIRLRNRTIKAN